MRTQDNPKREEAVLAIHSELPVAEKKTMEIGCRDDNLFRFIDLTSLFDLIPINDSTILM